MQATDAPQACRATRWIGAHALMVGTSWFPPLIVWLLLAGNPDLVDVVPRWLLGAGLLTAIVFAVPLSWPGFIALGLVEGRLAERAALGDMTAVRTASRTVAGLGVVLAAIATLAAIVAIATHDMWHEHHREPVMWAWTGPAALGIANLTLARQLRRSQ